MKSGMQGVLVVLALMATAGVSVASQIDVSIDGARALYYAAEYEHALSALDGIEPTTAHEAGTLEVYRAACLLALGRAMEAERAFERVVRLVPDLEQDELGFAPSITAKFAAVRARVLAQLDDGRRARPRDSTTPVGEPAADLYTVDDSMVSAPIPIRESIPGPPSMSAVNFTGTILVQVDISVDGTVEDVAVRGTIHPIYDAMIRKAAGTWRYHPATLDSQPVRFRKVLKIDIS